MLGNYADPGMEIEIARKHDLPFEFPKAVAEETKGVAGQGAKSEWEGREDLRELPLVTIDGETAKDFDDAVWAEKAGKGMAAGGGDCRCQPLCAPGMALDKGGHGARQFGLFSASRHSDVAGEAVNGLCSLNPEVDRLAMVCDMVVGPSGAIKQYRFYPAVFRSKARLTYTQGMELAFRCGSTRNRHPVRADTAA